MARRKNGRGVDNSLLDSQTCLALKLFLKIDYNFTVERQTRLAGQQVVAYGLA